MFRQSLEIRFLTEADVEAYWRLREEGLEAEPLSFSESAEEHRAKTPDCMAERFREGSAVAGAYVDGELSGIAGLAPNLREKMRHRVVVFGVYVPQRWRSRGIARALILLLIERARCSPGVDQIQLSVAANTPAHRLYSSLGFESFGLEKRALKIGEVYVDEHHMVLYLNPPQSREHSSPIQTPKESRRLVT